MDLLRHIIKAVTSVHVCMVFGRQEDFSVAPNQVYGSS